MANRYYCRVTNVTIPNAADIRTCKMRFNAFDDQVTSAINLTCAFVNADNPTAPMNKTQLDALSLTTTVDWDNLPAWSDGYEYQTPDLSAILQTVVDRAGWASGNAVILVIEDDSSPSEVNRKISGFEYLGATERPSLNISWYSSTENFFDNLHWQPAQLDPATDIETEWDSVNNDWNFNINADSDGGSLVAKGTWYKNYTPKEMTIYHDHAGTPKLKVYAEDGIIHETLAYTSGTVITPLWFGRSKGIYRIEFILPSADNTPFNVTNIVFNSDAPLVQTSSSTTSTISTTTSSSSTASTTSTSSTVSTTSSTASTTSTYSTTSTSSSTSSTVSTTSSTASTVSTHTTVSSTSSTASTVSTISTISTTTSTSSSTSSTASTSSSSSSTASTSSTTTTAP